MVQLAIGTKRKVSKLVRDYEVNLNGFPSKIDLNVLPLGLYDVLIDMHWLEQHHVMLDCLNMSSLWIDNQGNQTKIQGIPKKVFVRHISSLQAKKCIRKGCKHFSINIQNVEAER